MRKPKSGGQKIVEIYKGRQPRRPHFVQQWAEKRGFKDQAALIDALGDIDKSVVSRWYGGTTPSEPWQQRLAALFGYPGELDVIFRHPDDDWFARFFRDKSEDELERAKTILQQAFPKKEARH